MIKVDLRQSHLYDLLKDVLIWQIERTGFIWIRTALNHKLLKVKIKIV